MRSVLLRGWRLPVQRLPILTSLFWLDAVIAPVRVVVAYTAQIDWSW
ncbi:hypothetical protein [Acinetobacter dispersus]|nr:hypothetical protein [Acinetobacter dispersus]